jgi:hypothetical protein
VFEDQITGSGREDQGRHPLGWDPGGNCEELVVVGQNAEDPRGERPGWWGARRRPAAGDLCCLASHRLDRISGHRRLSSEFSLLAAPITARDS